MLLHNGLNNPRLALAPGGGQRHRGRRGLLRAAKLRPSLEALESRCLPAFVAPVDYTVGASPIGMQSGDFNGDGILDLATANSGRSVSVLLGPCEIADTTSADKGTGLAVKTYRRPVATKFIRCGRSTG